jgi:hypothetical protein
MPIVVGGTSAPTIPTTGNDGAASLTAVALRVVRLDAVGRFAVGPDNGYVTDQFLKVDFNSDNEAGQETIQRNASGDLGIVYRTPDIPKRLGVTIELTAPDPELEALLIGSTVLTANTPAVAAPTPSPSASASGGTLPTGSQAYVVTSATVYGESLASSPVVIATSGPTASVTLSIPFTTGAVAFGIYRLIGASYVQIGWIPAAVSGATAFTDTGLGAIGCSQGPPSVDSTGFAGTVGAAYPETGLDPSPCGVSVEFWTRAIIDGTVPPDGLGYIHWVLPKIKLYPGSRTANDGPVTNSFAGYGFPNFFWGTGPDGTWDLPSDRDCFRRREARYPLPSIGYLSTPVASY